MVGPTALYSSVHLVCMVGRRGARALIECYISSTDYPKPGIHEEDPPHSKVRTYTVLLYITHE